ncbi:MAG: hypothetical protein L3J16_07490, partial [Anaerolineales bacterium]|nr:hypothetical protein [Anaerolineales bacterium]
MFDGLNLGVILLLAGSALFGLIWFLSRYFAQMQPKLQSAIQTPDADVPKHADAVIMIGPGGRVEYVNAHARQWFGLTET